MTEVVVRAAAADDAEGFVRAHEAAWDAAIAPIVGRPLAKLAPFEERVERFRASLGHATAGIGAWVAESDGRVVGIAVRLGSELRDLSVVPEAWGTGVAARLMETALAAILADGETEATLWVGEENARARRFYEREGWRPSDETRPSPLGPTEVRYRITLA